VKSGHSARRSPQVAGQSRNCEIAAGVRYFRVKVIGHGLSPVARFFEQESEIIAHVIRFQSLPRPNANRSPTAPMARDEVAKESRNTARQQYLSEHDKQLVHDAQVSLRICECAGKVFCDAIISPRTDGESFVRFVLSVSERLQSPLLMPSGFDDPII